MKEPDTSDLKPEGPSWFTATHWTVVLKAQTTDTKRSLQALEILCQTYWFPLYSYVRRKGYSPHDAEDLTQGFFERLMARDFLQRVERVKGKFRSFLLAAMNHHLNDEYARGQRLKRGGGRQIISLDQAAAERRYGLEPTDQQTPELLFEKQWILTLLESVLAQLREDYAGQDKGDVFDALRIVLTSGKGSVAFAQLATELGMTEPATRMAASRLRQRYRELLRREIAHTVSQPSEIEGELRHFFTVLGR